MADGAAGFGQGSSDPALLRVPAGLATVSGTGLSPAAARLSRRVPLRSLLPRRLPYNPARASTPAVWAGPLSLAATRGVTLVFLSSAYLDVSVRRVRPHSQWVPRPRAAGFPIRAPADPWLLAPPRGISPPAAPFFASGSHRHPPCALSRLSLLFSSSLDCSIARLLDFASFFSAMLAHRPRSVTPHGGPASSLCLPFSHPVKEPGRESLPASCQGPGPRPPRPEPARFPPRRPPRPPRGSPGQTRTAGPHIISVVL